MTLAPRLLIRIWVSDIDFVVVTFFWEKDGISFGRKVFSFLPNTCWFKKKKICSSFVWAWVLSNLPRRGIQLNLPMNFRLKWLCQQWLKACQETGVSVQWNATEIQSFCLVKKKSPSQMRREEARRNKYYLNKSN